MKPLIIGGVLIGAANEPPSQGVVAFSVYMAIFVVAVRGSLVTAGRGPTRRHIR